MSLELKSLQNISQIIPPNFQKLFRDKYHRMNRNIYTPAKCPCQGAHDKMPIQNPLKK